MLADTLRIDSDTQRVELVFRALIPVRSEEHAAGMHVVVALARPGEETAWPEAPPAESSAMAGVEEVTAGDEVDDKAATLVRAPAEEPRPGGTPVSGAPAGELEVTKAPV